MMDGEREVSESSSYVLSSNNCDLYHSGTDVSGGLVLSLPAVLESLNDVRSGLGSMTRCADGFTDLGHIHICRALFLGRDRITAASIGSLYSVSYIFNRLLSFDGTRHEV